MYFVQINIHSSTLSITTFRDTCLHISSLIIIIRLHWWRNLLSGNLCPCSALVLFKFQPTQFEEISSASLMKILDSSSQSFVISLVTSILCKTFGCHWTMMPTLPLQHTGLMVIGDLWKLCWTWRKYEEFTQVKASQKAFVNHWMNLG